MAAEEAMVTNKNCGKQKLNRALKQLQQMLIKNQILPRNPNTYQHV